MIWDTVSAIEISERNKVTAMAAALNRELQQWMQDVHTAIDVHADFMPHDYHPPQYPAGRNASEEVEIQAQRSSVRVLQSFQYMCGGGCATSCLCDQDIILMTTVCFMIPHLILKSQVLCLCHHLLILIRAQCTLIYLGVY